jgi:hypothetical protein
VPRPAAAQGEEEEEEPAKPRAKGSPRKTEGKLAARR